MKLKKLQKNWDAFGQIDPMWAILTDPAKRGRKWQAEEFFKTGGQEIDRLMSHLEALGLPLYRRRALDFGCGLGRLSQALASHFDEVHGVDIAPSMIRGAEQYNAHGTRCVYHLNPAPSLELFSNDTFDLVYSSLVLQHIEPKYSANYIREFARVLAPSGAIVFRLPSVLRAVDPPVDSFKQKVKRTLPSPVLDMYHWAKRPPGPTMEMHGIEREQVASLLTSAGARVVKIAEDDSAGDAWVSFCYFATKA